MPKVMRWFIGGMVVSMGVGCAITPSPQPSPVPTPLPSPTIIIPSPTGRLTSTVLYRFAPVDVPACPGAQDLDKPIEFVWTGMEDVERNAPVSNWTFYRCNESPAAVAALYQHWLIGYQNQWTQSHWEERGSMTLGVFYFSTSAPGVANRWLYLWFLPDTTAQQSSYLVAAWWEAAKSC